MRNIDARFTYGDYRNWPEDERWELIDGVAYNMSPAPGIPHQDIVGEIFFKLKEFLRGNPCRVYIAPCDILFPEMDDQDEDDVPTVVQPDVLVYCDPSKVDRRGGRGAPDLLVEVLSPWTHKKDMNDKLRLYERHRVREYLVVDPGNESILVFRPGAKALYGDPLVLQPPEVFNSAVLEGFTLDLSELFNLS